MGKQLGISSSEAQIKFCIYARGPHSHGMQCVWLQMRAAMVER